MYFDAAVTEDMIPVYNATPDEMKTWLETCPDTSGLSVCVGRTLEIVSVQEYLSGERR